MRSFLLVASLMLALACKREKTTAPESTQTGTERSDVAAEAATPKEIIICDQKNARIIMVDIANGNAITWEWKATASYAMIRSGAQGWFSNLSEAKLVYNGKYVLATASGGGVALISVATKKAIWFDYAGGNTHSAELLPNGNIVTASTAGYLMIFTVDSYINDNSAQTGQIAFPDVHNVVWDHARQRLYCAGLNKLRVYSYNNSCNSPALSLITTYTMPEGNAHDLFPVYGSTTDLWLTNSGHIYKFNVTTGAFTLQKTTSGVKSVTSGPSGYQTIMAQANNTGGETWRTNRVLDINGAVVYSNTALGLYKARWKLVNTFSYPAGDSFHECTHP